MTKQRTVIVTGAARGIGNAIATGFVNNGDFVVIADINEQAAIEAANALGENAKGYYLDVTNEDSVQSLIEKVNTERGSIEVLVNNAGLQHRDPIEHFPTDVWRKLLDVMLTGPFLMTKHVLPHMKEKQFGRIINISSVHGQLATPEKSAYVSAKHGVIGLTRTTALETATDGITANAILPGPVRTTLLMNQINKLIDENGITQEQALEQILYPKQAMKRFIEPEEIASTAVFIASNQASAITGETFSVSGGI